MCHLTSSLLPHTRHTLLDLSLAKAIWHWQLDRHRVFNRHHKRVRWNISLAVIIGASHNPDKYCNGEPQKVAKALVRAWMEASQKKTSFTERETLLNVWSSGLYDMMCITLKFRRKLREAKKQLLQSVPGLPFPASQLW